MARTFYVSFGGITPSQIESVDKLFELDFEGEERIEYYSKNEYHHTEDDGLNFDYRYLITANLRNDGYGRDKWHVTLDLVPSPQSLCKSVADSVCKFCGIDRDDLTHSDINDYCLGVILACQSTSKKDPKHLIDLAASIVPAVDSMRGFLLDRRIDGTTGWDVLQNAINGVKLF